MRILWLEVEEVVWMGRQMEVVSKVRLVGR